MNLERVIKNREYIAQLREHKYYPIECSIPKFKGSRILSPRVFQKMHRDVLFACVPFPNNQIWMFADEYEKDIFVNWARKQGYDGAIETPT